MVAAALPTRPAGAAGSTGSAAMMLPRPTPARTRPIPVAAYPADTPRWVTHDGRRLRVVGVQLRPPAGPYAARTARRLQVELADGSTLLLLYRPGGWYERED